MTTLYNELQNPHHICAKVCCGRPESRNMCLISMPDTKPSRSVSAAANCASKAAFSASVTTQLLAAWLDDRLITEDVRLADMAASGGAVCVGGWKEEARLASFFFCS